MNAVAETSRAVVWLTGAVMLMAFAGIPLAIRAGETQECGHFYGLLHEETTGALHSGVPLDSLENPPPGEGWVQDHTHTQLKYKQWHDYYKPGWLEFGTEWAHTPDCEGGGSD